MKKSSIINPGYVSPSTAGVNSGASKIRTIEQEAIVDSQEEDNRQYVRKNSHNEFNRWINFGCEFMGVTEGVIRKEISGKYSIDPNISNVYELVVSGICSIGVQKLPPLPTEQKKDGLYSRQRYAEVVVWVRQGGGEAKTKFNNVIWAEGQAPEFSKTLGALDVVVLHTADSGNTWVGQLVAENCK